MPIRPLFFCLFLPFWLALASQAQAQPGEVLLGLERARQLASQRNVDVILGRLDVQLARLGFDVAQRPFVPILSAEVRWQDDTTFVVGAARSRSVRSQVAVGWQTRWGTRLGVSAQGAEFFPDTGFTPAPAAQLAAGITQPLIRDAWGQGNLLEVSELDMLIQKSLFLEQLNAFLVEVDQAYWNLALAQADLEIKEKSVQRATRQFEDTTENVRRGILAPGEVYVVEENLVFFQAQKIRAIQTLKLAQAELARVLFLPPETPLQATEPLVWDGAVEFERSLKEGLKHNPALQAQRLLLEQARAQTAFDRNQISPRLDLEASAELVSTADDTGRAWQEVVEAQNPDWRVGVVFEIPLVRQADYARVESAQVAATRAQRGRDQISMELQSRLYQLRVQLQQGQALLALAKRGVSLSLQKLEVEMQKYQSGLSTLFNVVQFQRDLDEARIGEQQATVSLLLLEARLGALRGELWAESGLRVD